MCGISGLIHGVRQTAVCTSNRKGTIRKESAFIKNRLWDFLWLCAVFTPTFLSYSLLPSPLLYKCILLSMGYSNNIKLYETFSNFALCSRTTFLSKSMSAKADSILSA